MMLALSDSLKFFISSQSTCLIFFISPNGPFNFFIGSTRPRSKVYLHFAGLGMGIGLVPGLCRPLPWRDLSHSCNTFPFPTSCCDVMFVKLLLFRANFDFKTHCFFIYYILSTEKNCHKTIKILCAFTSSCRSSVFLHENIYFL